MRGAYRQFRLRVTGHPGTGTRRPVAACSRRHGEARPSTGLREASLGALDIAPLPNVVGGAGDRTLAVAARWADGWNVTGPATPGEYAPVRERMRDACAAAGRTRPLTCSVQLFARDLELPRVPALIRDFEAAGATEVLFVLDRGVTGDEIRRLADAARP